MKPHFRDELQAIRDQLDQADAGDRNQIGHILIANAQLVDLVERLYQRVLDLERVQNERGEQ